MKSKTKKTSILLTIVITFALISNSNFNSSEIKKANFNIPKKAGGYTVPFIHIDGINPKNWSWTAGNYSWCYFDNGYYIIENVTIDATSSPTGSGIYIENSKNEYFIIRNCTIFNVPFGYPNAGIRLENTNNGTLINNNCSGNYYGIYLYGCEDNNINRNTASNNLDYGIFLSTNCEYNNITGNTINENEIGIYLFRGCYRNNISNNTANENEDYGIYLYNDFAYKCDNNIISNNTANENGYFGIFLATDCDNNTIIKNKVNDNLENGIYVYYSEDNNITGNSINSNNRFGIYLYSCVHNDITENTITGNQDIGIYLFYNSDDNEIKNNTINENDLGIGLYQSDYNNISGNTLQDNNWCILETDCEGNTIENNDCSTPTVELPIFIDDYATGVGAHNWTWAESQTWCSGSGTILDPYIIENLKISGFGIEDGIKILNSNVSFIIRDCLIYNSEEAIHLEYVNNSQLISNNCSNNDSGIYLEYSNNSTIYGNTANDNYVEGIYIFECDYINFTGNTVNDNTNGIDVDRSDYNHIIENIVDGNDHYGIYLEECNNNTVSGNSANNNYNGILLWTYSNNNTISGNTVNNNEDGIHLESSDFNNILDNIANDNIRAGIYLASSDYNNISKNSASGSIDGIFLESECYNNFITENNFNENQEGIFLYYSDTNYVIRNIANHNDDIGIGLEGSNNNTISGNIVKNNMNTGVYFKINSDNNEIIGNIIYNSTLGIYFESDCGNNSINNNFFLRNGKHAFNDGTDNKWNSTTIGNYWDNHTDPDSTPPYGIVDVPYIYIGGSAGGIDYLPIAEDGTPTIIINSPNPSDIFAHIAPSFNVIITDNYLYEMWYTLDGGLNNYTFTANNTIYQSAWDALPDGTITLKFYASDIPGNIGAAEVNIIKDIQAPNIIINYPSAGSKFGETAPTFNIFVTDTSLDTIWYSLDGGTNNYIITANGTINQAAWAALAEGSVKITFYANDTLGRIASEEITIIKEIPDTTIIIIIVVISLISGVALAVVIYYILKKRKAET